MKNHNPENERTKRAYFAFLKEAKGRARPPSTLLRQPLRASKHALAPEVAKSPLGSPLSAALADDDRTHGGRLR
jgi:hypothetical protein